MEEGHFHPLSPIPEELFSQYEGRPFLCCTRCGEGLADFEEGYKVSKVFHGDEVIFEYALCFPCMDRMMQESSLESQQRLAEFQEARLRDVFGTHDCALCENTRETLQPKEFALVAACQGTYLLESHLICIQCMDEMNSLVSEETRNQWNRFVEENFPGVPADFVPMPTEGSPQPVFTH